MVLSLVLSLPFLAETARAAAMDVTLTHEVELCNDLGITFRAKINGVSDPSNVFLRVNRQVYTGSNYTWETEDIIDYELSNGMYVFHYYGLAVTEMTNVVQATLYAEKNGASFYSAVDEFSVQSYCTALLSKYESSKILKDQLLCTTLVDMLNFGALAQQVMNVNPNNLANSKLTSSQKKLASELPSTFTSCEAYKQLYGSVCYVDHYEIGLGENGTDFSAFLRFSETPGNQVNVEVTYESVVSGRKTVNVPFSKFVYDMQTGLYKVELPMIKVPNYKTPFQLVVKKGTTAISGTHTYSVESLMKVYSEHVDEMAPILWTMCRTSITWAESAKEYFSCPANVTPTPTKKPTNTPTKKPTNTPTKKPTNTPTNKPTNTPTKKPTNTPTNKPTNTPTKKPTNTPTKKPTNTPTKKPTNTPTKKPTNTPTKKATNTPTNKPTNTPTKKTTPTPTVSGSISTYKNSKYSKDMPQAVIVIPASASAEEKYAANMLQLYISREDGYKPSIITDSTSQGSKGFEISVGKTNRPHGTAAYSSDGSYSIKSYTNGISILGVGQRGTIDGAAKFLSVCGGYFWLSFEDGYLTNQTHFKYDTNISIDYKRPFMFSDIDVCYGKFADGENRMFTLANGLNGYFANAVTKNQAGGQNWYLYDPETSHYPGDLHEGQVHTLLSEYFSKNDFNQHKDWFCLWKGERVFKQVCLSNKEVWEHIKEHVFKILKGNQYDPKAPMQIICLGQADNSYYCQCDACQTYNINHEFPDINGGTCGMYESAHYVELCNYISKAVKDAGYKNVYIDMLAYTWNYRPPKNVKIDDHVIVRFAAINRCYAHGCNDSECVRNNEHGIFLNEWARLCKEGGANLWIWDYNANWYSTIAPYPNIEALTHDIAYYKSIGVTGIYLQSNDRHSDCNTEFGDLRNYLGAVLLENPNADVQKEIDFFMQQFYGASAPYMKEYVQLMVTQAKNHQCGEHYKANPYYFRDKIMDYATRPMMLFANDYGTSYIWYNGREQLVDATEFMDAHNRLPDSSIARCNKLYDLAMAAVANDPEHLYKTERTLLSWRIVKSCLRVNEFADSSKYIAENRKLYEDIVQKFGTGTFSLIYRGIPADTDTIMARNPGEWPIDLVPPQDGE